jgi:D-alanine-D-alanine ligase-like ATP-grasp enzyme
MRDRVSFIHDRFGQGAIAEEFVDGRELYVGVIGNDDELEMLPITEMVSTSERVWLLEANANPFISYGHDMANAAAKAGMDYADFIQRIIDAAVARYERS